MENNLYASADELNGIRNHLRRVYAGVYDEARIESHIADYVGLEIAHTQAVDVLARTGTKSRLLDVGSGYGSFVLSARQLGADAIGLEPAAFELDFARTRLRRLADVDAESVYVQGNGLLLPFPKASFDAVTLWNVLEHVEAFEALLAEAVRVLKVGGLLYLVAPNYAAFRKEAHYHVPWAPLLPRIWAIRYLRILGRNPDLFARDIHYVTNVGVRKALLDLGMQIAHPSEFKLLNPEYIQRPSIRRVLMFFRRQGLTAALRRVVRMRHRNPLTPAINIVAVKAEYGR